MRTIASLLFVLVACSQTSSTDILDQAKNNPAGTWTVTFGRESNDFTVTNDRIEHNGYNFFQASGTVAGMVLKGFLVVEGETPSGYVVGWLRDSGGNLDTESNQILRVEGQELVLGGDQPTETTETARLRRN